MWLGSLSSWVGSQLDQVIFLIAIPSYESVFIFLIPAGLIISSHKSILSILCIVWFCLICCKIFLSFKKDLSSHFRESVLHFHDWMREQGTIHLHWSWEDREVRIFSNASSWGPRFLAVVRFGSSPTPSPPPPTPVSELSYFSVFLCVAGQIYWRETGRSQIKQRRESLVLYKSFNTLWYQGFFRPGTGLYVTYNT